jgi:heme exporter protein D
MGGRRGRQLAGTDRDDDVIWNSASDFFAMGGYGTYVWGAYMVTAACMAIEPIAVALRHRRVRRGVAADEAKR